VLVLASHGYQLGHSASFPSTQPPLSLEHAAVTPLPSVREELEIIARLIPEENLISLESHGDQCVGSEPTVDKILNLLPQAAVVHFACHGHQDTLDPLKSGFRLKDGKLNIAKIMQQQLPSAFFAFLAACETAKGDRSQPDQVIHLSSAMIFAGYQSVVGTMW
jgi:CHAT domain-containing protein